MGVCRGKISEGIDFKDDCCRGVIICGLPYGNVYDSKIIFKREFLDNFKSEITESNNYSEKNNDNNISKGNKWYNEEAMRSINQSIGRVIRHKDDYGAILFLDSRFSNNQRIKEISKWVRAHFRVYRDIDQIQNDIEKFFELFKGINDLKTKQANINNSQISGEKQNGGYGMNDSFNKIGGNEESSIMKQIGKNFQDCYIQNNKQNKHGISENKFVFNPTKKIKNQPKILSMIQNITKGKQAQNNIHIDSTNDEKQIFKTKDDEENNAKLDDARSLISAFRGIFSKDIYTKFFELIKETKKKNDENKYELLISKIFDLILENCESEKNETSDDNTIIKNAPINFHLVMSEKKIISIWELVIKLINNFFPAEQTEKCFFIIRKKFREKNKPFSGVGKICI